MLDSKKLARNVLWARKELGFTQEYLAEKVGVSRAYIANIEAGRAKNVGIDIIDGLASELGVTVPYLLGLSENALGENSHQVEQELAGESLTVEVDNKEQRRLLQDAIDALSALPPREQRRAVQLLRMMRQIEEEEQGSNVPPRIIG